MKEPKDNKKVLYYHDKKEKIISIDINDCRIEEDVINFLKETEAFLLEYGKTGGDVRWVGNTDRKTSWAEFKKSADFYYDSSFGGAVIDLRLRVVGDNWWLERHEYDGSERWEYKELPKTPDDNKLELYDVLEDLRSFHR